MHSKEFWTKEKWGKYPTLRGPRKTDVVIVGGGLTGMTTALWLCRAGLRVTLLEAETLACGATSRCAGMLSLTDRVMLEQLERQRGSETAAAYFRTQAAAFGAIRSLAGEAVDHFQWQDADANLLSDAGRADLAAEADALRRAGVAAEVSGSAASPLPGENSLILRNMAVLNPMSYFRYLTESAVQLGLDVYEHSRVVALETNMAQTEQGIVTAPYVIIATGYPVVNVPGWYFLRLTQRRRCLIPLSSPPVFEGMFLDAHGRYGLRGYLEGQLLQLDTGSVGLRTELDVQQLYNRYFASYLGVAEGLYEGVETFSADGLPYIGSYSRKTPNLFVAAGYGGKGLLGSMAAAQLISARVLGLNAESAYVFSGQRSGYSVLRRELGAAAAMAGRYLGSFMQPFAPRCPHMGCKLRYSCRRRLWECPCHGSRFDDIGHLLNAPAVEDAMIRRR